jgi:hypothetical protein
MEYSVTGHKYEKTIQIFDINLFNIIDRKLLTYQGSII